MEWMELPRWKICQDGINEWKRKITGDMVLDFVFVRAVLVEIDGNVRNYSSPLFHIIIVETYYY